MSFMLWACISHNEEQMMYVTDLCIPRCYCVLSEPLCIAKISKEESSRLTFTPEYNRNSSYTT